jgi:hypothetical protein
MTDSKENVFRIGGGGKLYADARAGDDMVTEADLLGHTLKPEGKDSGKDSGKKQPKTPAPAPAAPVATQKNLPPEPGRDWPEIFSTVLELTGITAISVGGWLIAPYVGLIILGVALVLLGAATSNVVRKG